MGTSRQDKALQDGDNTYNQLRCDSIVPTNETNSHSRQAGQIRKGSMHKNDSNRGPRTDSRPIPAPTVHHTRSSDNGGTSIQSAQRPHIHKSFTVL